MINTKTLEKFLLLSLTFVASGCSVKAQEAVPAEVSFVAMGVQNSREQVRCGQAAITYYELTPKRVYDDIKRALPSLKRPMPASVIQRLPQQTTETTTIASWYYQKPQLALFIKTDPTKVGIRYERLLVDDKIAKYLIAQEDPSKKDLGIYYSGSVDSPSKFIEDGIWKNKRVFDPRFHAYFYGGKPIDRWILENPTSVFKGSEVIYGDNCMKIETSLKNGDQLLFWVDVDHGFILRRVHEYIFRGGERMLKVAVEVPRLVKAADNWFPAMAETTMFLDPIRTDVEGAVAVGESPAVVKRFSLNSIEGSCILPPEAFVFDWPLGTNVADNINNEKFAITEYRPKIDKN